MPPHDNIVSLALTICDADKNRYSTWVSKSWDGFGDHPPLVVAALFRLKATAEPLIDIGADGNPEGQSRPPRLLTMDVANRDTLRSLFDSGAAVDVFDIKQCLTSLSKANEQKQQVYIVKLLLDQAAGVDLMDDDDFAPLSRVVSNLEYDVIRILVVEDAAVDLNDGYALALAARDRRRAIVQLVLDRVGAERTPPRSIR